MLLRKAGSLTVRVSEWITTASLSLAGPRRRSSSSSAARTDSGLLEADWVLDSASERNMLTRTNAVTRVMAQMPMTRQGWRALDAARLPGERLKLMMTSRV